MIDANLGFIDIDTELIVFPCKSCIPNNPWGVNCKITYQSSLCDTFLIYLTTALASWHTDYKSGNDYSFVLSKKLPSPTLFLYETLSSLWFGMHSKSFTRYKSILFLPANWHWKKTHITDGNQRCNYVSVCVWTRVCVRAVACILNLHADLSLLFSHISAA